MRWPLGCNLSLFVGSQKHYLRNYYENIPVFLYTKHFKTHGELVYWKAMAINPQSAYWKLRFQLQSSVAKNWSLKPLHFTIWISISSWKTQNKKQKLANGHSFQKAFGFSCSIMWVLHVIIHPLEKHLVWPQTIPKARPTFGPSWGAAREPAIRKKASEIYPAKLVLIRLCQKFLQCHLCQKKTDMVPKKKTFREKQWDFQALPL